MHSSSKAEQHLNFTFHALQPMTGLKSWRLQKWVKQCRCLLRVCKWMQRPNTLVFTELVILFESSAKVYFHETMLNLKSQQNKFSNSVGETLNPVG